MDIKVLRGTIRIKNKDHKAGDVIKQIDKKEGARLIARGVAQEFKEVSDEKINDESTAGADGKKGDDSTTEKNDKTKTPSESEKESADKDSKK